MKVDDRSEIAEHFICQLWEKKYFSTIELQTINGQKVEVIAFGIRNYDAGPDFKNISIKLEDKIIQGDLEIHHAPEDWYQHKHHADPAYNNVILHLIIGEPFNREPAIRLNRNPILAEVFVNISEGEFLLLAKKYKLQFLSYSAKPGCLLSEKNSSEIIAVINYFSKERLYAKAERFREQHQSASLDQVLYLGIMEALGYSKNQIPFRALANLLPFEALMHEYFSCPDGDKLIQLQGLLLGAAGLLPSQDTSFDWKKIKDQDTQEFVPKLEKIWKKFSDRLGFGSMGKDEWLFFRLRPSNFPTRRIAGASLILQQFMIEGILHKVLRIVAGLKNNHQQLIKELENLFICKTEGYWATHYRLEEKPPELSGEKTVTLVGADRAKEIVVNIILPVLISYANESEDSKLKIKILQIYQEYPKGSQNSVAKKMINLLFNDDPSEKKPINTAAKQQGLMHLYKLYCRRTECDRCRKEWEMI